MSAQHLGLFISHYGNVAVFLLMTLESACIPIPSEVVMPLAGYHAFTAHQSFIVPVLIGTLANVVGGLIAYAVGRAGGRPFIHRYGRYILLNDRHLERAEQWFARRGEITVFVTRLLPALRTFISLPAGVAKMGLWRFTIYTAIGSFIWNFALTDAGYQLGQHWETVAKYTKPLTYIGAVLLVAAVVWFWFGRRRASAAQRTRQQR
ncbi:DedA family protein [Alicyclobacillus sp. ALC3]|uniref:DedA family protein n=1 Tax=Alicyclobacillus sp. ALC3 TaxID=2796143 RepID=UPI002378D306|nr:DedA family protein [Alicyclobacillus sp. ALC3]WDL97964.1 DedA family protein [Alicyclobacillus sp. ALC3]